MLAPALFKQKDLDDHASHPIEERTIVKIAVGTYDYMGFTTRKIVQYTLLLSLFGQSDLIDSVRIHQESVQHLLTTPF